MITLALMFALYFLPTIVASHRGRPLSSILILNLLFGWTGIGWFALLLYAMLSTPRVYAYAPRMYQPMQSGGWQRF
ncbi:MAG: superinfection immunity protein [Janthinobacterium lividum]